MIHTQNGNVRAPGLQNRAQNQRSRVADGIQDGSLNRAELKVIKDMRADARESLAEAKGDDGKVGPKERRALHGDLNNISQTIYALKHN